MVSPAFAPVVSAATLAASASASGGGGPPTTGGGPPTTGGASAASPTSVEAAAGGPHSIFLIAFLTSSVVISLFNIAVAAAVAASDIVPIVSYTYSQYFILPILRINSSHFSTPASGTRFFPKYALGGFLVFARRAAAAGTGVFWGGRYAINTPKSQGACKFSSFLSLFLTLFLRLFH